MSAFSANAHHVKFNQGIYIATLRLSLEDYRVIRTVTTKEGCSIEIDRPYACDDAKITDHGTTKIGSIEKWGCRIYWRVE